MQHRISFVSQGNPRKAGDLIQTFAFQVTHDYITTMLLLGVSSPPNQSFAEKCLFFPPLSFRRQGQCSALAMSLACPRHRKMRHHCPSCSFSWWPEGDNSHWTIIESFRLEKAFVWECSARLVRR